MIGYETALQSLPSADADSIRHTVSLLHERGTAIVRRFASNVRNEKRLREWVWQRLFRAIAGSGLVDASSAGADQLTWPMRDALSSCARLDPAVVAVPSAIPLGPAIDDLHAEAYGRLVTYRQLSKMWRWSSPAGSAPHAKPVLSTGQVRNFIEDLTTAKGLAARRPGSVLPGCALGRYVMWSTFDRQALGPEP